MARDERAAETDRKRKEQDDRLTANEQDVEYLYSQVRYVKRRFDPWQQTLEWVLRGCAEVEARYKEAFNQDRDGGGWKTLKVTLPGALAKDLTAQLGLERAEGDIAELEPAQKELAGKIKTLTEILETPGLIQNIKPNQKGKQGERVRLEEAFTLILRPGPKAWDAHRVIHPTIDSARRLASGFNVGDTAPPALPAGQVRKVVLIFPEKTDAQREWSSQHWKGHGGKGEQGVTQEAAAAAAPPAPDAAAEAAAPSDAQEEQEAKGGKKGGKKDAGKGKGKAKGKGKGDKNKNDGKKGKGKNKENGKGAKGTKETN